MARRLNAYSHRRKLHLLLLVLFIRVCLPNVIMSFAEMEAARQRVLVRAKAAHKKGAPKRKADGKDDHPSKKPSVTPREKQLKKPSPPNPSHGTGKGLMTLTGSITQRPRLFLMHKGYTVETVESIIKQTDVDPYAE